MLQKRVNERPLTMALALCVILLLVSGITRSVSAQEAGDIFEATGVKGGLVVHLGCRDGRLTAALRPNESYVVHGLDSNAERIAEARAYIQSLGLYGKVSVERWKGDRLPYADNVVNLVVCERTGEKVSKTPIEEIMRVLAPNGVAYVKKNGEWTKTVKPRPEDTDEWTHYLHDASGNAVAHDTVVGPPRRVQWIEPPRHTRSHEHIPGIYALVSSGGRIFYIADEAPISSIRRPPRWRLVARDAYNGILLWKRPLDAWFPHIVNWGQTPYQLQRRLVAVGDRCYVTLGIHAPVSAVDAATGEIVKVFDQTRGAEEILYRNGVLLVAARKVTEERIAELEKMAHLTTQTKSPLFARESAQPLVKRFRSIENKGERSVVALDAQTGGLLWRKAGAEVAGLRALSLCAVGNSVFYQKGREVVRLDLKSGRKVWSVSATSMRVASRSAVICADRKTVTALSVETGKPIWTQDLILTSIRDAFVINDSLWLGGFKPWGKKVGRKVRGPAWGPYFATQRDLSTGKVLKQIEPEGPGHHHRCYRNKATDRYILGGRRGVEFLDLQTGDCLWHSWVRGVCRYGVMPANGLLYAPPHACGCYIAAKLDGFWALSPENTTGGTASQPDEKRLERGPAYSGAMRAQGSAIRNPKSKIRNHEWPTYRHDPARSGATPAAAPIQLARAWRTSIGGKLTAPVVAGGRVFAASVDEHTIFAIDAVTGKQIWRFTAGARIDSPPTIYGDQAIFGCRDGYCYSLRVSDGVLVWRLRAAREERRIIADGQLEAASPLFGNVLIQDGAAYFTAGRSSYLDGGIDLYKIQPETGGILTTTRIYSPDPKTGKQPKQYGPAYMPGALSDILTSDSDFVYLRDSVFDKDCARQQKGNPHLFTLTGFLDDTWPHRSYWIFGVRCSISTGCSGRERNLISGRLLAFDETTIYGYGRAKLHWSNQLRDGPYRLFALSRETRKMVWTKPVTIQVRAMALADNALFVAGPTVTDPARGPVNLDESREALLIAISASDGAELARYRLDSSPVFDGMAEANGRLYLAAKNGRVVCMAKE